MNNDLIRVTQLPIIEENLRALASSIDEKVERAKSLVCTLDTYKDIKAERAALNNEFKALEEQRKAVKDAVLAPYNKFEKIYKECVSNKYKAADADLKEKINEVETGLKAEKAEKVKQVFESEKTAAGLDWLTFEKADIKIGLSDSDKKLSDAVKNYIQTVKSAVAVIELQEYPDEILIEYKKTLNLQAAIKDVLDRKAELAAIKATEAAPITAAEPSEINVGNILESVTDSIEPSDRRIIIEHVTDDEYEKISVFLSQLGIKWRCE